VRVLLVSDLHANPFALEVLPQADVVLCMGDLVDYGPDPRAVIAWCRSRADAVVHGNHDRALAYGEGDGVAAAMREASSETRRLHLSLLDEADVEYLRALPQVADLRVGAVTFALTHAVADDPRRYVQLAEAATSVQLAVPHAQVIGVGHTHVQGEVQLDGAIAVNPGSLGMSNEGGRAHYAVWEDGRLTLHSEPYDVVATLAAVDAMPVPDRVRATLRDAFENGRRTYQH
jgi:predicted phosphodiesterase